jgi:signal transduction histidine kinase/ActR/RegA family two-component response regulator
MFLALMGFLALTAVIVLVGALAVCAKLYWLLRKAKDTMETLIAVNKNIETVARAKSEFLVDMSNEIRTPMNALTSFTEILTQRITQNSSTELREETEGILDIIKKSSHDLLNIINDVLDYIKIDANLLKIESVPTSIKQIIHDICHTEKPNVIAKRLDLSIKHSANIPPVFLGDPVRIRQILTNLIDNAIKFTEKGTITVSSAVVSGEDSAVTTIQSDASTHDADAKKQDSFSASSMQIKVSVTDTGTGLTQSQIREIFKPFRPMDSSVSQKKRSTGLGLSIAMRLATLMDGAINIESTPGQGSTFSLLLNVYVPEGAYAEAVLADREHKEGTGRSESQLLTGLDIRIPKKKSDDFSLDTNRPLRDARILIVEDMIVNQAIMATLLRDAGATVAIADNGALGVQKVMQDMDNGLLFDVVLMDMQMPVMDGYEATEFLRKHGYRRPIVAVTAHALSGDRERTLEAGCDDYITKPVDPKTLIEIIRKYLD